MPHECFSLNTLKCAFSGWLCRPWHFPSLCPEWLCEQEARWCSLVHFLPDAEVGGSGRAGVGELHDSLWGGKAVFRVLSLDWTRDICIMLKHGFVIRKTWFNGSLCKEKKCSFSLFKLHVQESRNFVYSFIGFLYVVHVHVKNELKRGHLFEGWLRN